MEVSFSKILVQISCFFAAPCTRHITVYFPPVLTCFPRIDFKSFSLKRVSYFSKYPPRKEA
jgi:hypothetical protein